jgi:uncharacterized membrane protein
MFLWENGVLRDLGVDLGQYSWANALNERGDVVGWTGGSHTADTRHALLWRRVSDTRIALGR